MLVMDSLSLLRAIQLSEREKARAATTSGGRDNFLSRLSAHSRALLAEINFLLNRAIGARCPIVLVPVENKEFQNSS
jgi:hypothetical protein